MATDAVLTEQLKGFFQVRGMREAGPIGNGCLTFTGNSKVSAVRVLVEDELSSRNSVLEAVLSTASLINRVNHVYLALPKLVSATIESNIIEEHGIGLIVYDDTTIEEAVAPKYFQIANEHPPVIVANEESHQELLQEMTTLRSRLKYLEEVMESLRTEVANLRSSRLTAPQVRASPSLSMAPVFEGAPSFIKDNPWVDVLSRRGRDSENLVS